MHSDHLR
ncbi:hypothetical protein EYF80_066259 [Liparis tanakae]|nr:hypothetical protein EYF80_066259 [Liparis tanakae]